MGNKNWMVGDARWNPRERQRVEEAFRRHVRTVSNPRGRILREPCPFCIREGKTPGLTAHDRQFHHLDYQNPFKGVWCCNSHHRKIEHGSVSVYQKDIWDYSSLVAPLLRVGVKKALDTRNAALASSSYSRDEREGTTCPSPATPPSPSPT